MIINKKNNLYIIYLSRKSIDKYDLLNYNDLYKLLKNVLFLLKKKYNVMGFCDIDIYANDKYGLVIEINNNSFDSDIIDLKVNVHLNSIFLLEIDYFDNYDDIYYYSSKYYTNYVESIDSSIIYKESFDIINYGIKVK